MTDARAQAAARAALRAFDRYGAEFAAITARAIGRFAHRDWSGMHSDAVERLGLYGVVLDGLVAECRALLGEAAGDHAVWRAMKRDVAAAIAGRGDVEIAETFFNSLTRRVFSTVGVNPEIEFVAGELDALRDTLDEPPLDRYRLVFTLDRVGRLVDAQEFEHLTFARERFAPALLDELVRQAPSSVTVDGETVEVKHLFTERRVTPLNLYLR